MNSNCDIEVGSRGDKVRVGGVVLCGGGSRRMGRDKTTLPYGAGTLLEHVIGCIAGAASPVAVVCRPGQEIQVAGVGVIRVEDTVADGGPLEGVACGLAALADQCDVVFVTGCDYPNLSADFVRLITERLGDADVCAVRDGDRVHPLPAAYSVRLASRARRLLDSGRSSLKSLLDQTRVRTLSIDELVEAGCDQTVLMNLNNPADYDASAASSHLSN